MKALQDAILVKAALAPIWLFWKLENSRIEAAARPRASDQRRRGAHINTKPPRR